MIKRTKFLKMLFYADTGRGKVAGRIWGYWSEILLVFTFLKVYDINASFSIIILTFILLFICFLLFGYYYIRFGLFEIEQEFSNKYNPMLKRIDEGIKSRSYK